MVKRLFTHQLELANMAAKQLQHYCVMFDPVYSKFGSLNMLHFCIYSELSEAKV